LSQKPRPRSRSTQIFHVIHIVALRQPTVAKVRKAASGSLKELAPAPDLRFNLKKVAYMLVAAFKTDNRG
jgi:hypothetical protein